MSIFQKVLRPSGTLQKKGIGNRKNQNLFFKNMEKEELKVNHDNPGSSDRTKSVTLMNQLFKILSF